MLDDGARVMVEGKELLPQREHPRGPEEVPDGGGGSKGKVNRKSDQGPRLASQATVVPAKGGLEFTPAVLDHIEGRADSVLLLTIVIPQTFVPLDVAVKARIAGARDPPTQILHLAHPSPVPWNSLMSVNANGEEIGLTVFCPPLAFEPWVHLLESLSSVNAHEACRFQDK
jgi:hypothetical protein